MGRLLRIVSLGTLSLLARSVMARPHREVSHQETRRANAVPWLRSPDVYASAVPRALAPL